MPAEALRIAVVRSTEETSNTYRDIRIYRFDADRERIRDPDDYFVASASTAISSVTAKMTIGGHGAI